MVRKLSLWSLHDIYRNKMSHIMIKPTKWHVRSVKTQISLGIRPVWSESSLSAWRKLGSLAIHWAPSLIRVFAVRMKKAWVLSYPLSAQRRLWSADAQADPNLRWAHSHFVGFVMRWLKCHWTWKNQVEADIDRSKMFTNKITKRVLCDMQFQLWIAINFKFIGKSNNVKLELT